LKLKKLQHYSGVRPPLVLIILDGVGNFLGAPDGYPYNAVWKAETPHLDRLAATEKIVTRLMTHGRSVGLPSDKDMGNSEVGHNAIGAGRIVDQGSKLVNKALKGPLFTGKTWREQIDFIKKHGGALHLIGLVSDGNVHSHIDQLTALIDGAEKEGLRRLFIHGLLDGRDVEKRSAERYFAELDTFLKQKRAEGLDYFIASGGGRMVVTMDRYEADWRIVERGWNAHVRGRAEGPLYPDAVTAILTLREKTDLDDQFMPAWVIHSPDDKDRPMATIDDGDGVIFFNFRGDRAIEMSRAFEDDDFDYFPRGKRPEVYYAGMTQYDGDRLIPKKFLVAPPAIDRTVSEYMAHNGIRQFAISETQKFGHVTYFWNGNNSGRFMRRGGEILRTAENDPGDEALEQHVEIPSDLIPTFSDAPAMKAAEIADRVITEIETQAWDFLRINFANGDMVGHTGDFDATVTAVETADRALGKIIQAVDRCGGTLIVTADHGNADQMVIWDGARRQIKKEKDGTPLVCVSHTLNSVFFIVHGPDTARYQLNLYEDRPGLANIAATLLNLLGFEKPAHYFPPIITIK
jgi:2,3-bisphosphoglycerate-independent phosphoglycerate mutase